MIWNGFWIAFVTIFLAELGDKTQLMCLSLGVKFRSFWSVFLGAMAAFAAATALAVLAAGILDRYVPMTAVRFFSGILLVALGILILLRKF